MVFCVISLSTPNVAHAGVLSFLNGLFNMNKTEASSEPEVSTQTMSLLQAAVNTNPNPNTGGGDITIVGGNSLLSEDGPSGTALDVEGKSSGGTISVYVVREKDTVSSIAKLFGVSRNTIIWANDIKNSVVTPGQTLVILPISGVKHVVTKGDTLKSIAKKYKADADEIASFNELDGTELAVGDEIIVPDGDATPPSIAKKSTTKGSKSHYYGGSGPKYDGYYIRPIVGGRKSQGLHGWNGIDLASDVGTPVLASASGDVIISRNSGWNGGYGNYIVLKHDNGTQTLYGHLLKTIVEPGQSVVQGQVIGYLGNTGHSTGPHLHFEIRGAVNPF